MPDFSPTFRNRLGTGFFALAALASAFVTYEHPSLLTFLAFVHNLALAFIYAQRKPDTAYDRTGLWLGLMAAFLPVPFAPETLSRGLETLGLAGYGLALWSLVTLGRSFGIAPADRGLVTTGPYRLVRHPMYLGELLLRGALMFSSIAGIVPFLILAFIQVIRIQREEKVISGYPDYARLVKWRLIPFIF